MNIKILNTKNIKWVHFGTDFLIKDLTRPISNTIHTKPNGGLWLSPLCAPSEPCLSEWEWFCLDREIDFKVLDKYVLVELEPKSKIIYIDSHDDLMQLRGYFVQNEFGFNDIANTFSWKIIDYEKLAQEYDGIYLTSKGAVECYYALYGWDIASLLLFNFDSISELQ